MNPFHSAGMDPEEALKSLRNAVQPTSDARLRIKMKMHARIKSTHLRASLSGAQANLCPPVADFGLQAQVLRDLARSMKPESSVSSRIWSGIQSAIEPASVRPLFDRIRTILQPQLHMQEILFRRLQPRLVPLYVPLVHRSIRWTAAFAVFLFVVRLSPLLFIAPHSIAQSPFMLLPTRGSVSILIGGVWQPVTEEMSFTKSALIRTEEGEATLVLHDDGVIRLGPNTTVALHDTADRPDPALHDPTLTLHSGKIWMQGLVPSNITGLTLATPQGRIELHEGSFSAVAGDTVELRVWDRRVHFAHEGEEIQLLAGERTELATDMAVQTRKISPQLYDESWVVENLRRDAVHRREIAQLQHERRAAIAGILPNSRLYAVKRAAEAVDVLLTFGEQAKAEKRLAQASTRLNEAAALLVEGSEQANEPLEEYRKMLLQIATGSGDGSLVQFMLKQELAEATADTAAALPSDDAYVLKKAVLEASAAVPGSSVGIDDVQGVLLVDTLSSLMRSVEEGNVETAKTIFGELQPYMASLDQKDSQLSPAMRAEAKASLGTFAVALQAFEDEVGGIDEEFLADVSRYLPQVTTVAARSLSDEEVQALAQAIYNRIFVYKQPRSRWNQLLAESRALDGHSDQGRVLRILYRTLPENGLARYVKTEFERVKEAKSGSQEQGSL
ncbi:MAG: DUF5667 domain-containing protein [Patescibacteria group bacterium]